jgi:hypothetical protein
VKALRLAGVTVAFVAAACNSESTGPSLDGGTPDTGAEGSSVGGPDGSSDGCPLGVPFCHCAYADGSFYDCGTDGGIPACPADVNPGVECAPVGASCLRCPEGAGVAFYCAGAATDAGAQWVGIGTGHVCKGP